MKITSLALALMLVLAVLLTVSCNTAPATTEGGKPTGSEQVTGTPVTGNSGTSSSTETPGNTDKTEAPVVPGVTTTVTLNGEDTTVKGEGAEFENGTVMITKGGDYTVTGKLIGGQIKIKVDKAERVKLILAGVEIKSETTSAIYLESADKLTIELQAGTVNKLEDGKNYEFEPGMDEPNACIYSADDLTIKGTGTLEVIGNYKNGISSKNDVKIKEATVKVEAYNTGIRGKDSFEMESGSLTVICGNDGIKSTNANEVGRGYILVTGGTLYIEAGDDALQAETDITASGCQITAVAEGKKVNAAGKVDIAVGCLN